nr:hypothetical protein [uncultured Cohaesibacter sp.]
MGTETCGHALILVAQKGRFQRKMDWFAFSEQKPIKAARMAGTVSGNRNERVFLRNGLSNGCAVFVVFCICVRLRSSDSWK